MSCGELVCAAVAWLAGFVLLGMAASGWRRGAAVDEEFD